MDALFSDTCINSKHIDILFVNSSWFNPTPSLSAMIVNKCKLRGNIRSFNLGGMGCSVGVIAIDLARDLLQVHRNTCAVVVSTENITQNWYFRNYRSMLIPNCLFWVGGAAILLSNRYRDRRRAKYGLVHVMRTHRGADEKAFSCVYQKQDDVGKMGVSLSKDLMAIVGKDTQNFWRAVEGFREGWGCHLDASREDFFLLLHRLVFNIAFLFSLDF